MINMKNGTAIIGILALMFIIYIIIKIIPYVLFAVLCVGTFMSLRANYLSNACYQWGRIQNIPRLFQRHKSSGGDIGRCCKTLRETVKEMEENGEDIPPHIYKKLSKLNKRDFLILAEELGYTVTLVKKETSPVVSGKKFQDRFLVWMQSDKSKRWRDL